MEWTRTPILIDLRRSVDKFSQLVWQAAKLDQMLTSIWSETLASCQVSDVIPTSTLEYFDLAA